MLRKRPCAKKTDVTLHNNISKCPTLTRDFQKWKMKKDRHISSNGQSDLPDWVNGGVSATDDQLTPARTWRVGTHRVRPSQLQLCVDPVFANIVMLMVDAARRLLANRH